MRGVPRWLSRTLGAAVASVVALGALSGVAAAQTTDGTARAIARVMDEPRYAHAEWGLLELDPRTGRATRSLQGSKLFVPGSVAKLFTVSTAWNTLGPGHRFVTPIYALGDRRGTTLDGTLVLQASGDLTLGGRTLPNGSVAFASGFDHTYANDVPGATLTAPDPLAGLDQIAQQVRAAGITAIDGDVAIDDRLWAADPVLTSTTPGLDPIMINDNLIDVQLRPTRPGEPAQVLWRPQTAAIRVESQVTTGVREKAPGRFPFDWQLTQVAPDLVVASGTIPDNAGAQLLTSPVGDPPAFARTALIEALGRAGVTVTAPAMAANPTWLLPPRNSYDPRSRIAEYRSPPYRQYARLILKVSHNLGAQVSLCLLAVHIGSDDCQSGFGVERALLRRARVDERQVALSDGDGGNALVTPRATVQLLRWWMHRPDFRTFQRSLPILGVDGDLGLTGRHSPARGKVFAKTGSEASPESLNDRLVIDKTMAGYLAGKHGRARPFALFMNNAFFPPSASIFVAATDLARIAALMQQDEPGAS